MPTITFENGPFLFKAHRTSSYSLICETVHLLKATFGRQLRQNRLLIPEKADDRNLGRDY